MIGGSSNADSVLAALKARIARLSNLTPPLTASGVIVRDRSVMRIKNQGGDQVWVPNKRGGHTGIDTGRMMNAIQIAPVQGNSITVDDNVFYARWFQEGTGIYAGHTAWTIEPKSKKALAFSSGGVTYVRRKVVDPGQPARVFLTISPTDRADILSVWTRYLNGETLI